MNSRISNHSGRPDQHTSGSHFLGVRASQAWSGYRMRVSATALLAALVLPGIGAHASDGATQVSAPEKSAAQSDRRDPLSNAQESFENPVKYAIYSTAWHLSSNAGLRIMAHNQSEETVQLGSVLFRDETGDSGDIELSLNMTIEPHGWSELELPYHDLLAGNDCVDRTLAEDWRLVEISNYTLNPSIRGLIIENTRQFRIYQCVRSVRVSWAHEAGARPQYVNQWLMYHFERIPMD